MKVPWNPFDLEDRGPCIKVIVRHTEDEIRLGVGLDYPEPVAVTALLDTGAQTTIINSVLATSRKLTMTNANVPVRGIGGRCLCDEYACSISFPDSDLPGIGTAKILARKFEEAGYSCLIGRDILRFWKLEFDARAGQVIITPYAS
ncbi:MAG: hypothetical protein WBQ52_11055 [Terracidiphilus sp.]